LVCPLESFGNVRWLFGESLGTLFCKPSLFSCVNWLTMQAKFFTLEFWFWANRFGFGCRSWLADFRDGFGFYVPCQLA